MQTNEWFNDRAHSPEHNSENRIKHFNSRTNLSENDFYEYFKQLSSEIAENNPEEVLNFLQNGQIFRFKLF